MFKYRDLVYIPAKVRCHLKSGIFEYISDFSVHILRFILNKLYENILKASAATEHKQDFFSKTTVRNKAGRGRKKQ